MQSGLQKRSLARLRGAVPHWCILYRLRHRLGRWGLDLFPRIAAQRCMLMLRRLARLVAPRVWAAVYRTLLNGWCTSRRFQQAGSCVFGCRHYEDSIDHYLGCPALARFGRDSLRLPYWSDLDKRRCDCLMLGPLSGYSDASLVCGAFRLAAAYRFHCHRRHSTTQFCGDREEPLFRALDQMVKDLSAGHAGSLRVLVGLWRRE